MYSLADEFQSNNNMWPMWASDKRDPPTPRDDQGNVILKMEDALAHANGANGVLVNNLVGEAGEDGG